MARPPFDVIRACFLLLALVVLIVMLETLLGVLGCVWVIAIVRAETLGACSSVGSQIRDIMSELITAILALIASSRGGRPPSNGEGS
jgi:hypothetical protein